MHHANPMKSHRSHATTARVRRVLLLGVAEEVGHVAVHAPNLPWSHFQEWEENGIALQLRIGDSVSLVVNELSVSPLYGTP